jgi:hypothetical protein
VVTTTTRSGKNVGAGALAPVPFLIGHLMIFQITLNMPSYGNALVHQILGEHRSNSLQEFLDELSDNTFIIVNEWYRNSDTGTPVQKGDIILKTDLCGKVKVFNPDEKPRPSREHAPRRA